MQRRPWHNLSQSNLELSERDLCSAASGMDACLAGQWLIQGMQMGHWSMRGSAEAAFYFRSITFESRTCMTLATRRMGAVSA